MERKKVRSLIIDMTVSGVIAGAACYFGASRVETRFKEQAVLQGHAEFYFDKDFNKKWRWKDVDGKEAEKEKD